MPAKRDQPDPVLDELRRIRGLLTLLLLKAGASSDEVALATGAGASTVRRDFPSAKFDAFGGMKKSGVKA